MSYQSVVKNFAGTLRTCVPAFIYAFQNNLYYIALHNINAAEYTAMYQLRILTTALLSVLMLRKAIYNVQWLALFSLLIGAILVQLPQAEAGKQGTSPSDGIFVLGMTAVIAMCWTSAFAGGLLQGWNELVWTIVILSAVGGLIVSAVMKYADNIQKTFCQSVAIAGTSLLAVIMNDIQATSALFSGTTLVVLSTYVYATEPPKPE